MDANRCLTPRYQGWGGDPEIGGVQGINVNTATLMAWLTYEYAFTKTGSIPDPPTVYVYNTSDRDGTYGLLR